MAVLNSFMTWIFKNRVGQIDNFKQNPIAVQETIFKELIEAGKETNFGKEHRFSEINNYADYTSRVPIRNYDTFKPFIDQAMEGNDNVIWNTEIEWFAKSSGTTASRSKYIPVTHESLEECHYKGGKDMVALYMANYPDSRMFAGKTLTIGGTLENNPLNPLGHARAGDISAVIMENLPFWASLVRTPSKETALMGEWEAKIEKMARETMDEDVTCMAGVPTWTIVLLQKVLELKKAKNITEVWPNLEIFFHGAVAFGPYRSLFQELIPSEKMRYMETYNASEGFFGIQDQKNSDELLLLLDYGIFYEFISMEEWDNENPAVIPLSQVEIDKNYALVITTNGGLWRYKIGDTVKFTSTAPYRFKISGRTKHFINAFGEEVIVENAEKAVQYAAERTHATIANFTAAPVYFGGSGSKGAHEWIIEFQKSPYDPKEFNKLLDEHLREINSDYDAKRHKGLALIEPIIHHVPSGVFESWMRKRGKLGGQHKVPRLSNSREYVEEILGIIQNAEA
ncbi:GH3 auxin-responsive promoter [Algoriphagus ratkowskyi]|uniref:GH3 auxin-responsive promoter n=1 Tax=Algoriphagus ratkowskyi TaxID=57028 RepID=A0A2W7RLJ8_9BACT|nr:GH3 auxin-responsive promoter family protein [Algoriphagus ratkowskyi]PZX59846.1 GH3 auxin-responsive promoter [Algoriphagus ratkowskyi]TXD78447.1 GH3 auxin-responsive promoter family protein [Algoriphagus ratkowskyi]